MIQPLKINKKTDNDAKLAHIIKENIPASEFMSADEVNSMVGKINEMVPAINVSNGGFQGTLSVNEKRVDSGFYIPTESGTFINADNVQVDLSQGINFVTYDGDKWEVAVVPIVADGQIEEGNMGFVSGGEVYKTYDMLQAGVNEKNVLFVDEYIQYEKYIKGTGEVIIGGGRRSRIVENHPFSQWQEENITIGGIPPDDLNKIAFYKENGEVIKVFSLNRMELTLMVPKDTYYMNMTLMRNVYESEEVYRYARISIGKVLYPYTSPGDLFFLSGIKNIPIKNFVNEDDIKVDEKENRYVSGKLVYDIHEIKESISNKNILNPELITEDRAIDSGGNILITNNSNQRVVIGLELDSSKENITISNFGLDNLKKTIFRDDSGNIIFPIHSMHFDPITLKIPLQAKSVDFSVTRSSNEILNDELQVNYGDKKLKYEEYKFKVIDSILGAKIIPKDLEYYDQSLNTYDDVEFESVKTKNLIYKSMILNLPESSKTPPDYVEVGDMWIDTDTGNVKVKLN